MLAALQDLIVSAGLAAPAPDVVSRSAGRCRPSWNDAPAYNRGRSRDCPLAREVTLAFLERAERGGCDVRLATQVPYRAKAWPRSSIDPHVWSWREILSTRWPTSDGHINHREVQASVVALRWRLRAAPNASKRFIHLTDSQVGASVLTKGRSSAGALRTQVRRWNALVLAGNVYPLLGYVASEDNPADRPSRRLRRKPVLKRRGGAVLR